MEGVKAREGEGVVVERPGKRHWKGEGRASKKCTGGKSVKSKRINIKRLDFNIRSSIQDLWKEVGRVINQNINQRAD